MFKMVLYQEPMECTMDFIHFPTGGAMCLLRISLLSISLLSISLVGH